MSVYISVTSKFESNFFFSLLFLPSIVYKEVNGGNEKKILYEYMSVSNKYMQVSNKEKNKHFHSIVSIK